MTTLVVEKVVGLACAILCSLHLKARREGHQGPRP